MPFWRATYFHKSCRPFFTSPSKLSNSSAECLARLTGPGTGRRTLAQRRRVWPEARGDQQAETASSTAPASLSPALVCALLGWVFHPDGCTVGHAFNQLPPKCTSILAKHLIFYATGTYCERTCGMLTSHVGISQSCRCVTTDIRLVLCCFAPGLVCSRWLFLHSAGGPLGLSKKFQVEFLLKRIPLLIP